MTEKKIPKWGRAKKTVPYEEWHDLHVKEQEARRGVDWDEVVFTLVIYAADPPERGMIARELEQLRCAARLQVATETGFSKVRDEDLAELKWLADRIHALSREPQTRPPRDPQSVTEDELTELSREEAIELAHRMKAKARKIRKDFGLRVEGEGPEDPEDS